MLDNLLAELIVLVITSFFAIMYHLYGFPLNLIGKKSYCNGEGYDFYNLSGKYREKENLLKIDFKDDFKRDKLHTYLYKNITITKTYSKIYIKGHMSAIEPDGTVRESIFKGKGEFLSGSADVACVNVKNYRETKDEKVSWNCVYFLRFSTTSAIEGYWITQDTEKNSRFVMGNFSFKRRSNSFKL